jgi:spermidine/putrescine transport system ATP-binding protein
MKPNERGFMRLAADYSRRVRGSVGCVTVSKTFGAGFAVRDVSLGIQAGEFLTLLGPSGCGKTTLLRLIAGFETPDRGQILISDRDVAGLPPYQRPVNTVFQQYALFPHRDVARNVAFGLEMAGRPADETRDRVAKALDSVRLAGFGERRIDSLSGGQKQRVALARAIVLEPEVLLLDEPMAALDLKLRKEMQVELKNLQERLQITFVFVTHDQDEALIMSDRIAVMNNGRIEQIATPEELYDRPRTRFVADFLAVRNILEADVLRVDASGVHLRTSGGLEIVAPAHAGDAAGRRVAIGIRPERIEVGGEAVNRLAGVIEDEIYLGEHTDWRVRFDSEVLTVAEAAGSAAARRRGDALNVAFAPAAVLRFEPEASAGGS